MNASFLIISVMSTSDEARSKSSYIDIDAQLGNAPNGTKLVLGFVLGQDVGTQRSVARL